MGESAQPDHEKPASASTFDVRAWLVDLTGVRDWQVNRTFTRRQVEFVTMYSGPGDATAQVTLRAVTTATSASWELRADLGHSRAGVVIPAKVRIKW